MVSKPKATEQAKKAEGAVGDAGGGGGKKVNTFRQSTLDDQASQQRKACTEDAQLKLALSWVSGVVMRLMLILTSGKNM